MNRKLPLGLIIPVACILFFGSALLAASRHQYTEQTGDEVIQFTWELSGDDPVTILSSEPDKRFENICRPDGSTLEWRFKGEEDWIEVVKDGDRLRFKAMLKDEEIEKSEELDDIPWFQALSFSLRQWLKEDRDSIRFWMIRPDDLEMHKLKAERDGEEVIDVGGQKMETYRVKVKLAGAFSFFWHVTYWFRKDDLLLVRYEGVHGPPGTPKTIITLN